MYHLKIDKNLCTSCGSCEAVLPKLLAKAKDDRLLISPKNMETHATKIESAINSCQMEALTLGESHQ